MYAPHLVGWARAAFTLHACRNGNGLSPQTAFDFKRLSGPSNCTLTSYVVGSSDTCVAADNCAFNLCEGCSQDAPTYPLLPAGPQQLQPPVQFPLNADIYAAAAWYTQGSKPRIKEFTALCTP